MKGISRPPKRPPSPTQSPERQVKRARQDEPAGGSLPSPDRSTRAPGGSAPNAAQQRQQDDMLPAPAPSLDPAQGRKRKAAEQKKERAEAYKQQRSEERAEAHDIGSQPRSAEEARGQTIQKVSQYTHEAHLAHRRHRRQSTDGLPPSTSDPNRGQVLDLTQNVGADAIRQQNPGKGRHVGTRLPDGTHVKIPRKDPGDATRRAANTVVSVQGMGPSTRYGVAARTHDAHPAQARNDSQKDLMSLESSRSGGRDLASVTAKMRASKKGDLEPRAMVDAHRHATFEQVGAQKPGANQRRVIDRNTASDVDVWAHGRPPASPSSPRTEPGSPRGRDFRAGVDEITDQGRHPDPRTVSDTSRPLRQAADDELGYLSSPGPLSEDEAYKKTWPPSPDGE